MSGRNETSSVVAPTAAMDPSSTTLTLHRFEGCLLGLALGDALGARFEGGPLERVLWAVIGRARDGRLRWTDDTQMTLDLAESLVAGGEFDQDELARRFARSYRWSRGYGPGTARVLRRIRAGRTWREAARSVYPEGSFGNGAAMRAPMLGLVHAENPERITEACQLAAEITHAHPLAIEGAALVAHACREAACASSSAQLFERLAPRAQLEPFRRKLALAAHWSEAGIEPRIAYVRAELGNGVAAAESCVTAIHLAVRTFSRPFTELHECAVELGGDVDTISAMAGAIWGARNGASALPADAVARLEQRERLVAVAAELHRLVENARGAPK